LYLAAAGVGKLGLMDFDTVDTSNLQRQILYDTTQVGQPKAETAARRLAKLNPDIQVVPYSERLTSENALDVFNGYDYVVDGTDNFPARYLINDACVLLSKHYIYGSIFSFDGQYGSIFSFDGQATVFADVDGPCYRCMFPNPPGPGEVPTGSDVGVIGILPGVIGLLQATETVKLITGVGRSLIGRLMLFDALEMRFREIKIKKDPRCPACGTKRTIDALIDYEEFCGLKGEDIKAPA
jgi:adenylyltransferase/sulfurtransferase